MQTLSVLTLNIWNKSGPYPERLPLIREELRRLSPDVFGAQEVLRLDVARSPGSLADQAAEVGEGMGYNISYAAGSDLGGGLRLCNALFTPHPIVETEAILLPGKAETGEQRTLLYTLVETPHGRLPTFVTHLNWKQHQAAVRLRQVLAISEHVFEKVSSDPSLLPPVVMGDFNAEPASDEIRYLTGLHVVEGKSVFFNDVWRYAGAGPGFTFDRKNPFARLSLEPPRRIDYIFVGQTDGWLRGEPISARLAFTEPQAGCFASDHFGVFAQISAEKRAPG